LVGAAGPRKLLLEQLSRTGYGHNFGEQPGGGPNVQGQLIVQILKPLLDKCVEQRKELQAHENIVSDPSLQLIDIKKRLCVFFILVTFFNVFNVFLFSKRFLYTLAKFRAAGRITRSTFKIAATK